MKPEGPRQIVTTTVLALALAVSGCGANPDAVSAQAPIPSVPISEPTQPPVAPEPVALVVNQPSKVQNSADTRTNATNSLHESLGAILSETMPITKTVVLPTLTQPEERTNIKLARSIPADTRVRSTPGISATNVLTTTAQESTYAVDLSRRNESANGYEWIPVVLDDGLKGWVADSVTSATVINESVSAPTSIKTLSMNDILSPFAQVGGGGEGGSAYPESVQAFLNGIQAHEDPFSLLVLLGRAAQDEPDYVQEMMQALRANTDYQIVNTDPLQRAITIEQGMGFPIGKVIPENAQLTYLGVVNRSGTDIYIADVTEPVDPTSKVQPPRSIVEFTRAQLEDMYGTQKADEVARSVIALTDPGLLDLAMYTTGVAELASTNGINVVVPPLTQGDIGIHPDTNVVYSQEADGFFAMVYNPQGNLLAEFGFDTAAQQWQKVEMEVQISQELQASIGRFNTIEGYTVNTAQMHPIGESSWQFELNSDTNGQNFEVVYTQGDHGSFSIVFPQDLGSQLARSYYLTPAEQTQLNAQQNKLVNIDEARLKNLAQIVPALVGTLIEEPNSTYADLLAKLHNPSPQNVTDHNYDVVFGLQLPDSPTIVSGSLGKVNDLGEEKYGYASILSASGDMMVLSAGSLTENSPTISQVGDVTFRKDNDSDYAKYRAGGLIAPVDDLVGFVTQRMLWDSLLGLLDANGYNSNPQQVPLDKNLFLISNPYSNGNAIAMTLADLLGLRPMFSPPTQAYRDAVLPLFTKVAAGGLLTPAEIAIFLAAYPNYATTPISLN